MTPADQPAPKTLRLDPAPSRALSSLVWEEEGAEVVDDSGRIFQPAGPSLTVRFRGTGAVWCYWPCSREEAQAVMAPGTRYDFSIGRAFSDLIRGAGKSSRQVRAGERPAEGRAGAQQAGRPDRRWLA